MAANNGPSGDLTRDILFALDKESPLQSTVAFPKAKFVDLKAALDRLSSRSMVTYKQQEREEARVEGPGGIRFYT